MATYRLFDWGAWVIRVIKVDSAARLSAVPNVSAVGGSAEVCYEHSYKSC